MRLISVLFVRTKQGACRRLTICPSFWIIKGKARCKYGLGLHGDARFTIPYVWHKLVAPVPNVVPSLYVLCTSVKFAQELHGARTISHDVLKIALRPFVKPKRQVELIFRTHGTLTVTLRSIHTFQRNSKIVWELEKLNGAKNRAGDYDSLFYTGIYSFV